MLFTINNNGAIDVSGVPNYELLVITDDIIPNKKYVDDNIGSANWTPTSYGGEESIIFPNGLILKQGQETVSAQATDDVTYGAAFPGAFVNCWVTYRSSDAALSDPAVAKPKSGSTKSILQVTNGDSSQQVINWFAIGY